jgi:uncharacterized protein (DUF4213/DUF364 family)
LSKGQLNISELAHLRQGYGGEAWAKKPTGVQEKFCSLLIMERREVTNMWKLYDDLINSVPECLSVKDYMVGLHWTIVRSERGIGLAKTLKGGKTGTELKNIVGMPLKELAGYVKAWNMLDASLGLAAINSILNTPKNVLEVSDPKDFDTEDHNPEDFNAFTNYAFETTDKNVAVVGHLPKIEDLRSICKLSILDRNPQPGDYPETACEFILPQQDLVFITGTAFINKTIPRLLELSAKARVILLGPSVPISPILYKHGVDVIAGMVISDEQLIWKAVQQGGNKNIYENGGQRICISR